MELDELIEISIEQLMANLGDESVDLDWRDFVGETDLWTPASPTAEELSEPVTVGLLPGSLHQLN